MSNPVITPQGHRVWYNNTDVHREDGPAVIFRDGSYGYFINDKPHRIDGPAATFPNGTQKWFIGGHQYFDNKSFQEAAKLTDEDMLMITLKHGNVE